MSPFFFASSYAMTRWCGVLSRTRIIFFSLPKAGLESRNEFFIHSPHEILRDYHVVIVPCVFPTTSTRKSTFRPYCVWLGASSLSWFVNNVLIQGKQSRRKLGGRAWWWRREYISAVFLNESAPPVLFIDPWELRSDILMDIGLISVATRRHSCRFFQRICIRKVCDIGTDDTLTSIIALKLCRWLYPIHIQGEFGVHSQQNLI